MAESFEPDYGLDLAIIHSVITRAIGVMLNGLNFIQLRLNVCQRFFEEDDESGRIFGLFRSR